jgi:uncharacterized protein (DUF2252 family)
MATKTAAARKPPKKKWPAWPEPDPPDERVATGKAARRKTPRSSHAEVVRGKDRPDPIAILEKQAKTREPDLVPIRYGRMLVSAFAFYRGAAAIMAADLADSPRSGFDAQLCGDAHLENFGVFAAPDRRLVFDVNDFDETLPGPWEWDVKRLAASFSVAGRERGFDKDTRRAVAATAAASYRTVMRELAAAPHLDVWYLRVDFESVVQRWETVATKKEMKRVEKNISKARTKDSLRAFSKLTHEVDGHPRIISDPPLIVPLEEVFGPDAREVEGRLREILSSYRATVSDHRRRLLDQYSYVHTARKVVGVGSVGTRAYIVLLVGRNEQDPLFLQAKEAEASVLEPFLGRSGYRHHGQRVVEGQRLMQSASDEFLGWMSAEGLDGKRRHFYVRQLWDQKGSLRVDVMQPHHMTAYAEICGATLARAHARSGDRIAIAAYLGKGETFDRAMADFAEAYAEINERDYQALRAAVDEGRVTAEERL